MIRWLLPIVLVACGGEERRSTGVGNPGSMAVEAIDVPPEISLSRSEMSLSTVSLRGCDPEETAVEEVLEVLDLLDPTSQDIVLPAGTWCRISLQPSLVNALVLGGETTG